MFGRELVRTKPVIRGKVDGQADPANTLGLIDLIEEWVSRTCETNKLERCVYYWFQEVGAVGSNLAKT